MNPSGSDLSRVRILIVDNDPSGRTAFQKFFSRSGFTNLTIATNGKEALEQLHAYSFEIALLNLCMPPPNGLGILKQIRQSGMLIDVVMFSEFGTIKEIVEAMKLGAHDYLEKPLDYQALVELVHQIVEKRQPSSQILANQGRDPITTYVHHYYHLINSREEVARNFGVCVETISNHISRATGQTFHKFLFNCRVERAKKLLESTDLNISQIAGRVGFSSPELFSRNFYKATQMTPTNYRSTTRG